MPPTEPASVYDLIHADEQVFERGMRSLASRPMEAGEPAIAQFTTICAALAATNAVGPRERERRATLILRHAPTNPEFLEAIGASAAAWPPDIRNAVARFLPARYKQLVYGKPLPSSSSPQRSVVPHVQVANLADAALRQSDDEDFPEVLLLGTAQEQDPNRRLLERGRYRPRRAGSFDEFRRLLTADVCGIVVGRSWWSMIDRQEHERFVELLCDYSSFAWLKIDIDGCSHRQHLHDACRNARYREAKISEVAIGETSNLNDVDLASLRRAADLIDNPMGIRLCPADIEPAQAQVLIAGVATHVQSRHYQGGVSLEEIATTTLQGGQSQALIIRAQPDDGGLPYIAKLAPISLLRDEMERFQRFILRWDDLLRPQFHFHDSDGAIIFGLVGTADCPLQPAPTLEDTLRKVLQTESGAPNDSLPSEADVLALIDRTVQKITSLNARTCEHTSMPSLAWIDVETFDAMIARGIQWQLPTLRSGRDPLTLRHNAAAMLVGPLRSVATIHGDMHLRNILVRDSRDPFLIDYAYAGPGHPCFDLVRFESALLFQHFRMTQDERAVSDLLTQVFSAPTTLDQLGASFPTLCASLGNRIALRAAIGARSACLQLLRQYGGDSQEYLAMQLVVACQSLSMQHLQSGIVRATIGAAAQLLDNGNEIRKVPVEGVSLASGSRGGLDSARSAGGNRDRR